MANYLKSQLSMPLMSMSILSVNNSLLLENLINSNLDELDESSLVAENEDVEDLTSILDINSA
eukprot:CAMPEP_0205814616 /NCGR_PEP_ID=MMETSP0205-20121125/19885_1 /ASSEMBLY_ACC=CAM_ASM_000278 /TAXON_ID=36767 /ORGANISM="Euplotes focardii, Strain TN1" /LENGTH=62 /DNA_ID=CAMNT_0053099103 /DNA_START=80 /DNA_END=268 /DNA_ORIENTATION=+